MASRPKLHDIGHTESGYWSTDDASIIQVKTMEASPVSTPPRPPMPVVVLNKIASCTCCRLRFNAATCPGVFSPGPKKFSLSHWSRIYLLVATVEAVLMLCASISIIIKHGSHQSGLWYALLAVLCVLGFLYFTVDAVFSENKFQFACSIAIGIMLTVNVILNSLHDDHDLGPVWRKIRWETLAVKGLFQVVYLAIALPTYRSFGFFAFKITGTSVELQEMFEAFCAFLSLLKFDTFLSLVLLLMARFFSLSVEESADFSLGLLSFVVTIVLALLGWFAVTRESKCWTAVFLLGTLYKPIYVGFKLYSVHEHKHLLPSSVTYTMFATMSCLSLCVRLLLLFFTYRMFKSFGRGLREDVFKGEAATGGRMNLLGAVDDMEGGNS